MANIRLIRRRIRSVQNTAKITRAMELVAASKMRRAQERGLAGRPYGERIRQVLADLAAQPAPEYTPALLQRREVKRIGVVHITPDRGLCGGLVTNINRCLGSFILEQKVPVGVVAVGRKGRAFAVRSGADLRADFIQIGDQPSLADTLPISRVICDDYTSEHFDLVYLSYTQFVNTMVQRPVMQQILPVEPAHLPPTQNVDYIYEPGPERVLDELLPRFVEMQVYQALLESIASEQSARMVAMRNATENAHELIEELTLTLNKARQEMITRELLDITGGVVALE